MSGTAEVAAGYDAWAATYDAEANKTVLTDELLFPKVIERAAAEGGWTDAAVLDAGCGTGRHTEHLAVAGWVGSVVAVDCSEGMLGEARARIGRLGAGACAVEFAVGDLGAAGGIPIGDASVDVVVCALVGEHIADLDVFFAELARVVRPGGSVLFSVYHPLLALRGVDAHFVAADGTDVHLGAFRHLVSDYVNALRGAGFELGLLEEPVVDDAVIAAVPSTAKYAGLPTLLFVSGVKRPVV